MNEVCNSCNKLKFFKRIFSKENKYQKFDFEIHLLKKNLNFDYALENQRYVACIKISYLIQFHLVSFVKLFPSLYISFEILLYQI